MRKSWRSIYIGSILGILGTFIIRSIIGKKHICAPKNNVNLLDGVDQDRVFPGRNSK